MDNVEEMGSLFQQPWWLEAVAPGQWKVAVVEKGGQTIARLPYVHKKKMGLSVVSTAPLTPFMGPVWQPLKSKSAKRLGKEKDLLIDLISQLPSAVYTYIPCQPSVANLMAFHWRGFDLGLRYTYRINDLSDLDAVWSGTRENVRTDVRKAEKQLSIRTDLSLDDFNRVNNLTFSRQGINRSFSNALVQRVDQALADRQSRQIFFAVDAQERIHAVAYLAWDDRYAYYLMGGADPELRRSGAQSFLMWEMIRFAATVSNGFDFEGSMVEPVERFFRAFGAEQTPYYVATRAHPLLRCALTLRQWGR